MKTAISIPDEIFYKAEKFARKKRIKRSNLYAKAISEYVERYDESFGNSWERVLSEMTPQEIEEMEIENKFWEKLSLEALSYEDWSS